MADNVRETIKEIKAKCRLYMNGVVSQSMREKGLEYKLNFGIEYPRIKEIAAAYKPDHDLAQTLWKENVRECKIMAGLLQPVETFYPELAQFGLVGVLTLVACVLWFCKRLKLVHRLYGTIPFVAGLLVLVSLGIDAVASTGPVNSIGENLFAVLGMILAKVKYIDNKRDAVKLHMAGSARFV